MSAKDVVERMITENLYILAELINLAIFGGEQVVLASELEIVNPGQSYKDSQGVTRNLLRDCAVKWTRNDFVFAFVGVESQSSIDRDMPLRVVACDGAYYREQLKDAKAPRYPVITLVLYYGQRPWTKYLSLKERLNLPAERADRLDPYVNDYRIHVIDLRRLTLDDIKKLCADLAFIALVFYKMEHPKEEVELPPAQDPSLAFQFLETFIGADLGRIISLDKLKQGGYDMDELVAEAKSIWFDEFREEVLAEGLENGRAEGSCGSREEERQAARQKQIRETRKLANLGLTINQIANVIELDRETINLWLDERR